LPTKRRKERKKERMGERGEEEKRGRGSHPSSLSYYFALEYGE